MATVAQPVDFLTIALAMAARGAPVIPLAPGDKFPPAAMKGWSENRSESTDPKQLETWAKDFPTGNCGAVCRPDGLLILDDDADFFLAAMATVRTLTVESRPGHRQYYFWQSERSRKLGNVTQGLGGPFSVRSSGYYGLAPGSVHPETHQPYCIVQDAPIVPVPDLLIDVIENAVTERRKKTPAPRGENGESGFIPSGERNVTLTSYAGSMRNRGMSESAILAALLEENREHCDPPLSEDEVEKIVASVASYAPAPPESRLILPPKAPEAAQTRELHFETALEFAQKTPAVTEWIIHSWVARGSMVDLVAKIKSGKTTLVMALTAAVVNGTPFLDCASAKSDVIYLSEQPETSLRPALAKAGLLGSPTLHLAQWQSAMGIPWPVIVAATIKKALQVSARLIVIDTLGQFSQLLGDAENSSGAALEILKPLQVAQGHKISVLLVRHERKGEAETADAGRGSSAFSGAVDTMMRLSRLGATHPVNFRKLTTLGRFEETPPETVIELTPEGYRVRGETGIVLEATRQLVLLHLPTTQQGARTESELEKATAQTRSTLQRVLGELRAAGIVKRSGSGKKHDPYRYCAILKERGNLIV